MADSIASRLDDLQSLFCRGQCSLLAYHRKVWALEREGRAELLEMSRQGLADRRRLGIKRTSLQTKRLAAGAAFKVKMCELQLKSGPDPNTFQMYACVWGNRDLQNEICAPMCVSNIEEFVSAGMILLSHDQRSLPIAYPVSASQDSKGMRVVSRWHTSDMAQQARTIVRERLEAGKFCAASIGYVVHDESFERVEGRQVRRLKSISVYECSICNLGANPLAGVVSA